MICNIFVIIVKWNAEITWQSGYVCDLQNVFVFYKAASRKCKVFDLVACIILKWICFCKMNFVLLFSPQGADVHVLIDAISSVMMLEEKDLCKTGELAIAVMRETAFIIMGDLYKVGFDIFQLHAAYVLLQRLTQFSLSSVHFTSRVTSTTTCIHLTLIHCLLLLLVSLLFLFLFKFNDLILIFFSSNKCFV